MDKENIFKMDLSEIDNTMDNVLKGTTPEKLSKELYGDKDIKENSNAADTNVATIEEDIQILEEFIDGLRQYNTETGKDIKPTQFGEGQRYVYSNVYYAIDHILSAYKRVLEMNEILLKENEELRIKNNAIKRESEAYAEDMIRLDNELNQENKRCMMLAIEKQDYFEKYRYHLQQNESLTKEFSNVIPVQKIKDELEELKGKLEDISRRREKSKTKEEETVLWCLEIRTDERIKTLQELL